MKVRDSYRPTRGVLALLLDCPKRWYGRRCVVVLHGRRGAAPVAWPCPHHERPKKPRGPSMAEDVAALGSPDIWKSLEAGARIGAKVRRKRKGLRYVGDKE